MIRNEPLIPAIGPSRAPDGVLAAAPWPPRARGACGELARVLAARGLHITQLRADLLLALNPLAGRRPVPAPHGAPGLKQLITCRSRPADDRCLWFWWVWSITPDHSPVELQPLCPATQATTAAARIAAVLAVRDDGSSLGL